jgi:hypothetical protein
MSRPSSGACTETSDDVTVISAGPVGQSVAVGSRPGDRSAAAWFESDGRLADDRAPIVH